MRVGIRGKILAIYGLGFCMVLAISFGLQALARQAGGEFETRLNHYWAMQSLRVLLQDIREKGELYFREATPALKDELRSALSALPVKTEELKTLEAGPGEIAFRAIAARRGLEAYLRSVGGSFEALDGGDTDAYQLYLAADRVAAYVDRYLDILLSASLKDGTDWYRTSAARSDTLGQVALFANAAAVAAATILVALLAGSISKPIRRLALVSERMAAGDLDVDPVVAKTGDEVETLARSFSTMSQNLREMVVGLQEKAQLVQQHHRDELALVELDRDLKEARFYALQSRIRPHFLFNALNTVARSALLENASQTEELTRRLATLMRYSLGTGQPFFTIGEELAVVKEYLQFQESRFGKRLDWDIRADADALPSLIPRFTLQPFVENAVLHGIEPRVEGGKVSVVVRACERRIKLAVADTGMGMDALTLARVRRGMTAHTSSDTGVGTASLEARLSYKYQNGTRSGLYSRPGRGTLLVMVIPRGEYDER